MWLAFWIDKSNAEDYKIRAKFNLGSAPEPQNETDGGVVAIGAEGSQEFPF